MKQNMLGKLIRVFSVVTGVAVLLFLFKDVDVVSVSHSVASIGLYFVLILSVYLIGSLVDTLAWKIILQRSNTSHSFFRLLCIHIAGESFYRFIPAGAVVGESVKILLAKKHLRMEYPQIISSLILRKLFMGIAQALYIGLAVLLGVLLSGYGQIDALEVTGGALAIALLLLFCLIGYWTVKGKLGSSIFSLLLKIPIGKIQEKVASMKGEFSKTDSLLSDSLRCRWMDVTTATGLFFLGWMSELAETVLILFALGAALSFTDALLFEPVVSLLRSIAFIMPGGVGVMDAGYVSAFRSFGISNAAVLSAAFIVIKRTKELFWILIGVVLTAVLGGNVAESIMRHLQPGIAGETA